MNQKHCMRVFSNANKSVPVSARQKCEIRCPFVSSRFFVDLSVPFFARNQGQIDFFQPAIVSTAATKKKLFEKKEKATYIRDDSRNSPK